MVQTIRMEPAIDVVPLIDVADVSFGYGSTPVLSHVTFSVNSGDFVGLIGPNGSGKTTLLKLILGLYPVAKGQISIGGTDIAHFSDWKMIGYVPQKAIDMSGSFPASVREVVLTGLLSTKKFPKRYASKDHETAADALRKVDMERFIERRIGELSGGQQQRVLIARALITNPKMLILDEPTTGIDQKTQESFYALLGQLNKQGISILLVSHDLSRITNHVTKIASLNRTLEFYGNHEQFCRHPGNEKDHHCLMLRRG